MSDKLESVLVDAIQKTQAGIGEAVDFAIEQAPDVIHQLLLWKSVESGACFIAATAVFIFAAYWTRRLANSSTDVEDKVCIYACSSLWLGPTIIGMLFSLDWLKIWIAPKLYLVEYAASLVK